MEIFLTVESRDSNNFRNYELYIITCMNYHHLTIYDRYF